MITHRDPATIPPIQIGSLLAATPHALIGGHAVNAWVEPRLTRDVDCIVTDDSAALATRDFGGGRLGGGSERVG